MFKAKLAEPSILKDSVSTISELIHEGIFKISSDSLYLRASDRATVAVVDFKLEREAFEEFECDEEMQIGVNLEDLLEILKRAKKNDSLTLEVSDDASRLKASIGDGTKREFEMPLLSLSESDVPETKQLEFDAELKLKSSVLKRGIADAEIVADSVLFTAEPGKLTMKAESDSGSVEARTDEDSEDLMEIEVAEKTESRYPIDYLESILKASKISDIASVKFGTDYPMELKFEEPDRVKISFVLAPRVEE
ncbi:MAG: proliferating cell nuclear antigen (pcna) [Candidatus Aenigmatarchaeota archaeon]